MFTHRCKKIVNKHNTSWVSWYIDEPKFWEDQIYGAKNAGELYLVLLWQIHTQSVFWTT